jgi:SET domain-containing protein
VTVQNEMESELHDNEELKDSYTLSQRTRSDLEEELSTRAQYEECNQVLLFQLCQQMMF